MPFWRLAIGPAVRAADVAVVGTFAAALRKLLIASAAMLAAVPAHSQSAEPAMTIEVAAFPAVDQIARAAIPAWQKLHPNIGVNVISRELADHHTAMATSLATRSHLPDVMAIEIAYFGRFANSGGFLDLRAAPYNADSLGQYFVPYAFAQATSRDGKIVALPGDVAPATVFYRADVLQRAGVTEADLTRSWDSFVQTGVKIKQRTGVYLIADARDVRDVILRSGLKPGEGLYFDTQGHSLLATPRFRRAFELARQVRRENLDAHSKAWTSEWIELLRSGHVATQIMGSWLGGHLANWLAPQTTGLWRASNLPEGGFVAWGGTFYAIPTYAPHPKEAFEFIRLLTLDRSRQLAAAKDQNAFPSLVSAQSDPFFDEPVPFFGGERVRQMWSAAVLKVAPVPVHPLDTIALAVVDAALDKVLTHDLPIDDVLREADQQLQRRAELTVPVALSGAAEKIRAGGVR